MKYNNDLLEYKIYYYEKNSTKLKKHFLFKTEKMFENWKKRSYPISVKKFTIIIERVNLSYDHKRIYINE